MERRFRARLDELHEDAEVPSGLLHGLTPRLELFLQPFVASLQRDEQRRNGRHYVRGLLSDLGSKDAESIAYLHDRDRQGLQKFLGQAPREYQPGLARTLGNLGRLAPWRIASYIGLRKCMLELSAAEKPSVKPNIVLILADDLGYGDLGCYGSKRVKTPNIDRLAREGLRFTDFHSNGSTCSPTRAALMTGRYQQRSGIDEALSEKSPGLKAEERTIAEYLNPAG